VKGVLTLGEPRWLKERTVVERGTDTTSGVLEPATHQFDAFGERHKFGKLPLSHLAEAIGRHSVVG
jgi:hypothetical protein